MVKHNTEQFFIKIGEKIAKVRKESGLSQEKLASLLSIRQPVLASYEIGRRRIPLPLIIKIAEILNIFVDDLLPLPEEKKRKGPKPKIDRDLEKVKLFPEDQQKAILNLIETLSKSNQKSS